MTRAARFRRSLARAALTLAPLVLLVASCASKRAVDDVAPPPDEGRVTAEEALLFSRRAMIPTTLLLQLATTGEFHLPREPAATEVELRARCLALAKKTGERYASRALEDGDVDREFFGLAWLREHLEAVAAFDARYLARPVDEWSEAQRALLGPDLDSAEATRISQAITSRATAAERGEEQDLQSQIVLETTRAKLATSLCVSLDVRTVIGTPRATPGSLLELWRDGDVVAAVRVADAMATIDRTAHAGELEEARLWLAVTGAAERGLAPSVAIAPLEYGVVAAILTNGRTLPESERMPGPSRFPSLPIWESYARALKAFQECPVDRRPLRDPQTGPHANAGGPTDADDRMSLIRGASRLLCVSWRKVGADASTAPDYVPGFARRTIGGQWYSICSVDSPGDPDEQPFCHLGYLDKFLGTTWIRRIAGDPRGLNEWLRAGTCGSTYGPVDVRGEPVVLRIDAEIGWSHLSIAGREHWFMLHREMEMFERYCSAAYLAR